MPSEKGGGGTKYFGVSYSLGVSEASNFFGELGASLPVTCPPADRKDIVRAKVRNIASLFGLAID